MSVNIGTTTTGYASSRMPERKPPFKVGSVWFVVYCDGTNMVYQTSADKVTWGSPVTIRACASGSFFACRYYNYGGVDYLYYVYLPAGTNVTPYFCRSSIAGSTITVGTEYAVATANSAYDWGYPDVEVCSDGYVLVTFGERVAATGRLSLRWYYSANNDGNGGWSYSNTIFLLGGASSGQYVYSGITRLNTAGYAYAIGVTVNAASNHARGKLFSGVTHEWGASENIVNDGSISEYFSVASSRNATNGDDVYFGYTRYVGGYYDPFFRYRTYSTSTWGAEEAVTATHTPDSIVIMVDSATGDCYAFWENGSVSNQIVVTKRTYATGAWGTTSAMISGETDLYDPNINPSLDFIGTDVCFQWTKGISPKYQVFYAWNPSPPTNADFVQVM